MTTPLDAGLIRQVGGRSTGSIHSNAQRSLRGGATFEGGPRCDPRSPFGQRLKEQIDWANRRQAQAERDGDPAASEAWRGYVAALRWVQSIGSPNPPARDEGVIVEIFKIDGGIGKVKYRRKNGTEDRATVVAEGWGERWEKTSWPPRVGDTISIFNNQVVFVKERNA